MLFAKKGNWKKFKARKKNKRFLAIEQKIIQRDEYKCSFCEFSLDKFYHVVNKDNDYSNNSVDNMVTSCSMCAQCLLLDGVRSDSSFGGYIVQLPEMTQSDLNHFCRALFSSMLEDKPYTSRLQTCYLSLQERSQNVETIFGPGSSDAGVFGSTLVDISAKSEYMQHPILKDLRVLPKKQVFEKEAKYWRETIFSEVPL